MNKKVVLQVLKNLSVIALFFTLTIIMTYPFFSNMSNAAVDLADTFHNVWSIGWVIKSIKSLSFSALFDTNIMYPLLNTGAFAEVQISNALLIWIIDLFCNNLLFSYNILLFLSFIVCGYLMFLIGYEVTGSFTSGIVSGVIYAFFPFKYAHLPHIQLLTCQWVLIGLYCLIRHSRTNENKYLFIFTISFILQSVTFGYVTIFLYFITSFFIAYNLIRLQPGVRFNYIKKFFWIWIPILICTVPFYIPFLQAAGQSYVRTFRQLRNHGTDLCMYFASNSLNKVYGEILEGFRNVVPHGEINALFPGCLVYALFAIGLVIFIYRIFIQLKKMNNESIGDKIVYTFNYNNKIFFFVLIAASGFLFSLGPYIKIAGNEIVPSILYPFFLVLLRGVRYLPAFIMVIMIGVSIICAYTYSELIRRYKSRLFQFISSVAVVFFILFEFYSAPIHLVAMPVNEDIPSVYKWLNDNNDGPILELPLYKNDDVSNSNFWNQYIYMYYSTYHWNKMINGITGFFPIHFRKINDILDNFPDEKSIEVLQSLGVKKVIIHESLGDEDDEKKYSEIKKWKELRLIKSFNDKKLFPWKEDNGDIIYKPANDKVYEVIGSRALQKKFKKEDFEIQLIVPDKAIKLSGIPVYIRYINQSYNTYVFDNEEKLVLNYCLVDANKRVVFKDEKQLKMLPIILPHEKIDNNIYLDIPDKSGEYDIKIEFFISDAKSSEKIFQQNYQLDIPEKNKRAISNKTELFEGNILLKSQIPPIVKLNEYIDISYQLENTGHSIWLRSKTIQQGENLRKNGFIRKGQVKLLISFHSAENTIITREEVLLPINVFPGEVYQGKELIAVPEKPGIYRIEIALAGEEVVWNSDEKIFNIKIEE